MPAQITVRNAQLIKHIKTLLDDHGILDKQNKISKTGDVSTIYTTVSSLEVVGYLGEFSENITVSDFTQARKDTSLTGIVRLYLGDADAGLVAKVPKKWSVYPPMVLFGSGTFDSDEWTGYFATNSKSDFFSHLAARAFPKITHFAVNRPIIETDVMRRPFNLVPLYGDFGPEPTEQLFSSPSKADMENAFWCHVVQNGIYQTWAPRYTMFSRGNITEKKRILDTYKNLHNQAVFDLYAGIGYFTLSYLANGATLFCWEVNPWSIEGLTRGLTKNGYKYRLITGPLGAKEFEQMAREGVQAYVFHESNEQAVRRVEQWEKQAISHFNLGLLPSLKPSWDIVRNLQTHSTTGSTVHVHENIHKNAFDGFLRELETFFDGQAVHLEKVKTFAPDIWHVVVDLVLHGP